MKEPSLRGLNFFIFLVLLWVFLPLLKNMITETTPSPSLFIPSLEKTLGAKRILLGQKMDLSQASSKDLKTISGIGDTLAKEIVSFRQKKGPFNHIQDLLNVKGIGPKKLKKILPYVEIL